MWGPGLKLLIILTLLEHCVTSDQPQALFIKQDSLPQTSNAGFLLSVNGRNQRSNVNNVDEGIENVLKWINRGFPQYQHAEKLVAASTSSPLKKSLSLAKQNRRQTRTEGVDIPDRQYIPIPTSPPTTQRPRPFTSQNGYNYPNNPQPSFPQQGFPSYPSPSFPLPSNNFPGTSNNFPGTSNGYPSSSNSFSNSGGTFPGQSAYPDGAPGFPSPSFPTQSPQNFPSPSPPSAFTTTTPSYPSPSFPSFSSAPSYPSLSSSTQGPFLPASPSTPSFSQSSSGNPSGQNFPGSQTFSNYQSSTFGPSYPQPPSGKPSTSLPAEGFPSFPFPQQTGFPSQQPGYPSAQQPGYPSAQQPGYPSSQQPGYPSAQQPGNPTSQQPSFPSAQQPSFPSAEQPSFPSSLQPSYPSSQQELPQQPYFPSSSSEQPQGPSSPFPQTPQESFTPASPSAFNPDIQLRPNEVVTGVFNGTNKHVLAHIHDLQVQCSKDRMTINIEFDKAYEGIIYSKGHYNNPQCRYVQPNTNEIRYTIDVQLNSCGTDFIDEFNQGRPAYLENVLVFQNEPGIQEAWDFIKRVRCTWEKALNKSVSVGLSVDKIKEEISNFSGDTAEVRMDVQVGYGPYNRPAEGLIKIGEPMTLVVSVEGDPDFDIGIYNCFARDTKLGSDTGNSVALTDNNGCILKHKVLGSFQKTVSPQTNSKIAFAFFQAFKFPEETDLYIGCDIQLVKGNVDICPYEEKKFEPGTRRRRSIEQPTYNITKTFSLKRKLSVFSPDDVFRTQYNDFSQVNSPDNEEFVNVGLFNASDSTVCLSTPAFFLSSLLLVSITIVSALCSSILWVRLQMLKKLTRR